MVGLDGYKSKMAETNTYTIPTTVSVGIEVISLVNAEVEDADYLYSTCGPPPALRGLSNVDDAEDTVGPPAQPNQRGRLSNHSARFHGEVYRFSDSMKESDAAQMALDHESMELERRKHDDEHIQRAEDRE